MQLDVGQVDPVRAVMRFFLFFLCFLRIAAGFSGFFGSSACVASAGGVALR